MSTTRKAAGQNHNEPQPSRLNRMQAQVIAIETQKVEGRERGLRPAAVGQERSEFASAKVRFLALPARSPDRS